jgi:murein L,D-transpeptidase YcbB/YkuD
MKLLSRPLCLSGAALIIWLAAPLWTLAQTAERDALRQRLEWLETTPDPAIGGEPIAVTWFAPALYARRGYQPAWTDAMLGELLAAVKGSAGHGLTPDDFHGALLGARMRSGTEFSSPAARADTEIIATDALARLAVTLKYGKLDPTGLDPAWNLSRDLETDDPVGTLNEALNLGQILPFLESMEPPSPMYRRLREGLLRYREIMAAGGWPSVPEGPTLELGSQGDRVSTLRRRLEITGDLSAGDALDPIVFDAALESAVESFQARHGIDVDGKVGPRTLEALNFSVEARIDQIRATLERIRWVFREITGNHIIVDLAGFQLYLFRDGELSWTTRVQVGKPYHATPVFKDTIRYITFNPTWTIPPGILRNETLPAIRKDPSYLSNNNMSVITGTGARVNPSTIDWAATPSQGFSYMIRQEPGDHNALGRVKFMFPNKYMVYLHDTPSKGLFARSERAFSHGCVRTENPLQLAELLLGEQGWDQARIDQVLESKKTTRVDLETPMPVMLLYWTAEAEEDGTMRFRKDFYDRDAAVIEGLDEPFRVDPPAGTREAVSSRLPEALLDSRGAIFRQPGLFSPSDGLRSLHGWRGYDAPQARPREFVAR